MRRFVLLCAALLLSGCGHGKRPIEPPASTDATANTSGAPAAKTTLEPPKLPAVAKRNDATGAANFVVYWVKAFNYASHTGSTGPLRQTTDANCGGCFSYIHLYERTYDSGGYFRGSDWSLSKISVESGTEEPLVRAHVSAPEGAFRRSASAPVERGNDENADLAFGVRWTGTEWHMSQLGFQSEIKP
jgi:hypothetical protein